MKPFALAIGIFSLSFLISGCSHEVVRKTEVTKHTELHCPGLAEFSDFDFADPTFYVVPPLEALAPGVDYGMENTKHLIPIKDQAMWCVAPEGYDMLAKMTDTFARYQGESQKALLQTLRCIRDFNARARVANAKAETELFEGEPEPEKKPFWKFW